MPRKSFYETVGGWDKLERSMREREDAELAHLEPLRTALASARERANTAKAKLMKLQSRVRLTARELAEILEEGREVESRLRSSIKGVFGVHGSELVRHGISPRRKPRRKAKGGEEPGDGPAEAG